MSLNLEEAVEAGSGALGRNYCCRQCKNPIVLSPDLENLNNAEIESMFNEDMSSSAQSKYHDMDQNSSSSSTSNMDHQLQVTARLFDILSGRTETNHPMCQTCAHSLIKAQTQLLEFQREEIACLENFLAQLKLRAVKSPSPPISTPGNATGDVFFSSGASFAALQDPLASSSNNTESSPGIGNNADATPIDVGGEGGEKKGSEEGLPRVPIFRCSTGDSYSMGVGANAESAERMAVRVASVNSSLVEAREHLFMLQREFASLQAESHLLDKQMEYETAELHKKQEELDRLTSEYNKERLILAEAEESFAVLNGRLNDAVFQYRRLRHTNVLSAAFPIYYDGHIGIINGLHLGRLPNKPIGWPEINGALGQCAMLVTCLAKKFAYSFKNYVVIPMGSQSKIAALPNGSPLPLYNTTGNIRFFNSSNFDNALVMFLDCVRQLQRLVEQPPEFCLPYQILENGAIRDTNGANLLIKWSGNTDENWSKALKMLLIDLSYITAASIGPESAAVANRKDSTAAAAVR